jgi:hypothetical protein
MLQIIIHATIALSLCSQTTILVDRSSRFAYSGAWWEKVGQSGYSPIARM